MRKFLLAALAVATALPATAVSAQGYGYGSGYSDRGRDGYGYGNGYGRDDRVAREFRECRRELSRTWTRRQYERELRECRREIADARRHEWRDRNRDRYDRDYRRGY
jgi:hypothetical protein